MSEIKKEESKKIISEGRRFKGNLGGFSQKLSVSGELDWDNYHYRWANDLKNRLHDLTVRNDYEFTPKTGLHVGQKAKDGNNDLGSYVRELVGTKESGEPLYSYLMRIPKKFFEENQAVKEAKIAEQERMILEGNTKEASDTQYVVDRGRGSKIEIE